MHWRRKWQPTPVFLPGASQGWGSLVGCRLWGRTSRTWLKWLSGSGSSHLLPCSLASLVAQTVQETQVWSWVGKIPWRRKWQPTPGFFPGESHGQRSLVGYSHGVAESDTTEQLLLSLSLFTSSPTVHLFYDANGLIVWKGKMIGYWKRNSPGR